MTRLSAYIMLQRSFVLKDSSLVFSKDLAQPPHTRNEIWSMSVIKCYDFINIKLTRLLNTYFLHEGSSTI